MLKIIIVKFIVKQVRSGLPIGFTINAFPTSCAYKGAEDALTAFVEAFSKHNTLEEVCPLDDVEDRLAGFGWTVEASM